MLTDEQIHNLSGPYRTKVSNSNRPAADLTSACTYK